MTSAVRAVPKSGFLGSRLGCGDIHALNRCFILTISPALYPRGFASATAEAIPIEGVRVPFLSLEMLIKSRTTCREQDRADLVRLRDLLELKCRRGGEGK